MSEVLAEDPAAWSDKRLEPPLQLRRCVIADERVLAHKQPQGKNVSLVVDPHAIVCVQTCEDELRARPLRRNGWNDDHQSKCTYI